MDWVIVYNRSEKGAAHYGDIENFQKEFKLRHAVSLKSIFPEEATVRMRKSMPGDIALVDNLSTMIGSLVVSEKVCRLFEKEGVKNLELLPIHVLNHKGKPVKDRYFVINVLTMADCVDVAKSEIVWNKIDPTVATTVRKLVIDPAKIPEGVKICRPKSVKFEILFHRSLADKIEADKLKGFGFVELDQYWFT
jgi:hypothetical protein